MCRSLHRPDLGAVCRWAMPFQRCLLMTDRVRNRPRIAHHHQPLCIQACAPHHPCGMTSKAPGPRAHRRSALQVWYTCASKGLWDGHQRLRSKCSRIYATSTARRRVVCRRTGICQGPGMSSISDCAIRPPKDKIRPNCHLLFRWIMSIPLVLECGRSLHFMRLHDAVLFWNNGLGRDAAIHLDEQS